MLPTVDFCGLTVTRLILGANPFGGFSHQNPQRDTEMREYYTVERIVETWKLAEAAGINTMITNNESLHVVQAVKDYLGAGGTLQWIAQVACRQHADMLAAIDEVVDIGCRALYFHGGYVDGLYSRREGETLRAWCGHARAYGIPVGVAGHSTEVHLWVDSLDTADFHAVCFFNCGSLHDGNGSKFRLADMAPATECIRRLRKPCLAYKVLGAGRIEARMGLEYAFANIKDTDVVNLGMHRGDRNDMVEFNAALVRELLS